jgi:hypothetical protein
MAYVMLPPEWGRLTRNLSPNAQALFLACFAYERQNPEPGDLHLTIPAEDVPRAVYVLSMSEIHDATAELLACGWWKSRGRRVYIGGPPEIADRHYSRETLDAKAAASAESSRKHRARKRAAELLDERDSESPSLTAKTSEAKTRQGDMSRDVSRGRVPTYREDVWNNTEETA